MNTYFINTPQDTFLFKKIAEYLPFDFYYVGGCVRDLVLHENIKDYDITSSLTPQNLIAILKEKNISFHETGIEHGTVTIMMGDVAIEHTTFRKDVSTDGRNATVEFALDITEDIQRRDFTINALYGKFINKNDKDGIEVYDTFDGVGHTIVNMELVCVGNTKDRFEEDYLRVLRAFRFASRFDLQFSDEIHKEVCNVLNNKKETFRNLVSMERVFQEFKSVLDSGNKKYIDDFLYLCMEYRMFDFLFDCEFTEIMKIKCIDYNHFIAVLFGYINYPVYITGNFPITNKDKQRIQLYNFLLTTHPISTEELYKRRNLILDPEIYSTELNPTYGNLISKIRLFFWSKRYTIDESLSGKEIRESLIQQLDNYLNNS